MHRVVGGKDRVHQELMDLGMERWVEFQFFRRWLPATRAESRNPP